MRPVNSKNARRRKVDRRPPSPPWLKPTTTLVSLLGGMFLFVLLGGYSVSSGIWQQGRDRAMENVAQFTADLGMTVQEVYAIGRQRTKVVDIRSKIEKSYGQNILMVDIGTMQQEIEALPWIKSAAVTRQLPDRLLIDIKERRPMALWQSKGRVELIDESGEIIPILDLEPFVAMPVVSGEDAPQHTADLFNILLQEGELARRVTAAQRVDGRRWNIYLDGEIEVRMPDEAMDEAWSMLAVANAKEQLLERAIDAVDLRSHDWMILKLMDLAIDGAMERPI